MTARHKEYLCIDGAPRGAGNRKVLLAYPRTGADARGFSLHVPLSLLYLASNLRDFEVAVFDERVDSLDIFEKFLEEGPVCVGISTMTGKQIEHALGLARIAKRYGVPTVFGGVHPTLLPHETAADLRVDHVVAGEGEIVFRHLVEQLASKSSASRIVFGQPVDMNKLSLLEVYEHIDTEAYIKNHVLHGRSLPVQLSRGCPFRCAFCCNTVLSGNRWRKQDLGAAMTLVNGLVSRYHLDAVWFVDENLTVRRDALGELAAAIDGRFGWFLQSRASALLDLDLGYLDAMGLEGIGSGLESGSQEILNRVRKQQTIEQYIEANQRLGRTQITIWYNYMMGYPNETLNDLKLTVQLALRMLDDNPRAFNNTFYLLSPYPGTAIGDQEFAAFMPTKLEDWARFGRHNVEARWHRPEMLRLYERITMSSKFVGRKLMRMFPNNEDLRTLCTLLAGRWRNFDFEDEGKWQDVPLAAESVLTQLFGENAY